MPSPLAPSSSSATAAKGLGGESGAATFDANQLWRAVVAELKGQRRDLLAMALAHGRILEATASQVRLGFGPADGMFRSQAERGIKDAEAALTRVAGAPTRLTLESVSAGDATPSMAQEDSARERAREERAEREGREHPAVLAALRILGGAVEHIRVLEPDGDGPLPGSPEEGEETEADET